MASHTKTAVPGAQGAQEPSVPRLAIEYWPASRLIPYAGNPRKNDQAVERMRQSIREFGFAVPILAVGATSEVIDGHLRLKGGLAEGMTEFPVIPCDGWTEAQIRAFRLMANRSVAWADWDPERLKIEFEALQAVGFDVQLTGFDQKEIAGFTVSSSPAENAAPPAPEVPVSRLGDLWVLGDHRILCGDSTSAADVIRVMDKQRAHLIATDPPYLVDYNGGNHPQGWQKKLTEATGTKEWDDYVDHDSAVKFYVSFLNLAIAHGVERAPIYQWHADLRRELVIASWRQCGLLLHEIIVWVKSRPILTRSHYMWQHEPCAYGWTKGSVPPRERRPAASEKGVWMVDQQGESDGIHPTQKPVELFRRPMLFHTRQGEVCYEPFSGSGTSIAAAELTKRRCFAMEISPAFVDVAVTRWQNLTQREAVLEGDGRTFAAVKSARFLEQLGAQDEIKEHVEELAV